ncbi:MAG: hypothetical protein ACFFG0_11815 [Candidatus Thorarchaeota archaeon]
MSEDNNSFYLSIKDIINETLVRDLIIFSFLFLLIITQVWESISLLLFPLITFACSIFFRIVNTNKWRIEFEEKPIIYNPIGLERKHANRLFFTTLFQLILVFWIGAESLYNPHIVDQYFPYFNWLFIFLYTFGFFWIFIDLWKFSKIEIILHGINEEYPKIYNLIISFLKTKNFRLIALINLFVFFALNIVNSVLIITSNQDHFLGIQLNLPGTGSGGSDPMTISSFVYFILFLSPLFAVLSLILAYRDVADFNIEDLDKILESLPKNFQIIIIEHLKALDCKIKDQLNIE